MFVLGYDNLSSIFLTDAALNQQITEISQVTELQ
jgi:hypothetical protein